MADARSKKGTAAALSLVSNVLITVAKLVGAILTGSVSVLSEAAHSLGDIAASGIAWVSVRVADKPADAEHPFGHGKVESIAGLAESLLLAGAALFVGIEAITRLYRPEPLQADLAFYIILGTAVCSIFVGRFVHSTAIETDSEALKANAAHIFADVVTSAGVLAALLLVWITNLTWIDPVAGLLLSVWIVYVAARLAIASINILIDVRLPDAEVELIEKVLRDHPRIQGFHQLRTRKAGSYRHIDAHILMDDNLTLIEAHNLTEEVEDLIRDKLPNVSISLHMEPHMQEIAHRRAQHSAEEGTEA